MQTFLKSAFAVLILGWAAAAGAFDHHEEEKSYDMINASEPVEGLLVGGQISEADIAAFHAEGVTTIINLRPPEELGEFEEERLVRENGMTYINIPVHWNGQEDNGISAENAALLNSVLQKNDGKTVLHCASGFRAASLLAMQQHLHEGLDKGAAIELAVDATGERVRNFIEDRLETLGK